MSLWEDEARQTVLQGRASLERMADSLANSHRVAIETEEIGTSVAAELGEQRESLLRSKRRLEDTEQVLNQSRSVIRRMTLHVLTNKIILIIIILLEMGILGATVYLKHFKR
ncbi:vesicle transport through interaction with t-SNAREs homolog 1B [Anabrus simplex]|uniref:vesicle transport through interaction with t-SNAREs homolog 1B n=1 Tax=Anabrus simplex TaxID=316456 RepID=UPI0035A2F3B7